MNIRVVKNDWNKYPGQAILQGHEMIVNALLLSDSSVVSAGWDGKVKLWDLESAVEAGEARADGYVNALSWQSGEEGRILYAGGKDGQLLKIKL